MKRTLYIALFASASILPFAGIAAEHDHGSHHSAQAAAPAKSQLIEATIKKLDKEKGRVTLSHGPLPDGMPSMTMIFNVKDKAVLKGAKEGGKALFRAENVNGAMELVEFKPLQK